MRLTRTLRSHLLPLAGLTAALAACAPAAKATQPAQPAQPVDGPAATAPAKVEAAALALPNQHGSGDVITAGQPSLEQLGQAKALGYRTIVNLRPASEPGVESEADVRALGLDYVSIPVTEKSGLTEANARALAAILADANRRPVIVHCGSANRAGALFALKAFFVDQKPSAEAVELGKSLGLTKLEPTVRALLDEAARGAEKK